MFPPPTLQGLSLDDLDQAQADPDSLLLERPLTLDEVQRALCCCP